ncbi:MAG: hypothetical protein IT285_04680 [Bdellovibrionales bacterium]|nr:hypothetical protein [Bdellovibrionales bacterium]
MTLNRRTTLQTLFALTLASSFLLGGCRKVEELNEAVTMKLDPSLNRAEKSLLRQDVLRLMRYELGGTPGRWFAPVFGGNSGAHALRFLDARVNYLLSERVKFDSRLKLLSSGFFGEEREVVTMAQNVGTVVYFVAAIDQIQNNLPRPRVGFQIGNSKIPVQGPRIGIIQLGAGYSPDRDTPTRIGTLIHEARHSDCSRRPSNAEFQQLINGNTAAVGFCGNLHGICPAGHAFAGYAACDDHAWGSYAVEGVFQSEVARRCISCTERERQSAAMSAADSFSRVRRLDALLAGTLGAPVMTTFDQNLTADMKKLLKRLRKERMAEGKNAEAEVEASAEEL